LRDFLKPPQTLAVTRNGRELAQRGERP
jgi:hypothetical protein